MYFTIGHIIELYTLAIHCSVCYNKEYSILLYEVMIMTTPLNIESLPLSVKTPNG